MMNGFMPRTVPRSRAWVDPLLVPVRVAPDGHLASPGLANSRAGGPGPAYLMSWTPTAEYASSGVPLPLPTVTLGPT